MDALINSDPKPREPLPEIWVNSSIWCLKITSLSLSTCKYMYKTLHAMGMKMAPAYANIFMSKIEHQYHSDQLMETKSFCGNFRRWHNPCGRQLQAVRIEEKEINQVYCLLQPSVLSQPKSKHTIRVHQREHLLVSIFRHWLNCIYVQFMIQGCRQGRG